MRAPAVWIGETETPGDVLAGERLPQAPKAFADNPPEDKRVAREVGEMPCQRASGPVV